MKHKRSLSLRFAITLFASIILGGCSGGSSTDYSDNAEVTGHVMNDSGDPIANATVTIQSLSLYEPDGYQVDVEKLVLTNADGEYTISLSPGTYNIVAYASGYRPYLEEVEVRGDLTVDIDLVSAGIGYVTGRVIMEGADASAKATLGFLYSESSYFYGPGNPIVIELKSIEVLNGQDFLVDLPVILTAAGGYSLIVSSPDYSTLRIAPLTIIEGVQAAATVLPDIRLWRPDSVTNLLANPDFETGSAAPWISCLKGVGSDETSCIIIPDMRTTPELSSAAYNVHRGTYGLPLGALHVCGIDNVGINGFVIYQTFLLPAPGLYEFSGWVKIFCPSFTATDRVEISLWSNGISEKLGFAPSQIRPLAAIPATIDGDLEFDEDFGCNKASDWFYFYGYFNHTGSSGDSATLYLDIKDYLSVSQTTCASVDDLFVRRIITP